MCVCGIFEILSVVESGGLDRGGVCVVDVGLREGVCVCVKNGRCVLLRVGLELEWRMGLG